MKFLDRGKCVVSIKMTTGVRAVLELCHRIENRCGFFGLFVSVRSKGIDMAPGTVRFKRRRTPVDDITITYVTTGTGHPGMTAGKVCVGMTKG